MDVESLARLVPLGGVTILLIYLLGLLMTERSSWVRERSTLVEQWAEERIRMREEHREDLLRATADLKEQMQYLRARVADLEKENTEIRTALRERHA